MNFTAPVAFDGDARGADYQTQPVTLGLLARHALGYSVATDILGYLVEVIFGQPLDQYFAEQYPGTIGHGRYWLYGTRS